MSFFDNEIIRSEAAQLFELYERLMQLAMTGCTTLDQKKEYLQKIQRVVELQEVLYFRAKYSEQEDASEFVEHLRNSANMLGYRGDIESVFISMKTDIEKAIEILKSS